MGSFKKSQKFYLDNYKSLGRLLSKLLLIFGISSLAVISVLDCDTTLDTTNSRVQAVARWKRSEEALSEGLLPYTDFSNSSQKSGYDFWRSFQPSFDCPARLLRKVGDVGDAGKWICGLNHLGHLDRDMEKDLHQAPCSVYSTGSKENSFFEVEVISLTNCTVYSYEPSAAVVDHPLSYFEDRIHLEPVLIGGENRGYMRTLKTLMQKNNQKWVDIVKLNVGDGDLETLENILEDWADEKDLPIGQLLVRLSVANWKAAPRMGSHIVSVFEGLENKGMRMFQKEVSPFYKDTVADFSFVNGKALERYLGKEDMIKYVKHALL